MLEAAGHRVVVPDLPGRAPWDADSITVSGMADHAVAALARTEGPWIAFGHSGGGMIATMVAERLVARQPGSAAELVYLASMMLPSGMAFPRHARLPGAAAAVIEPYLQPTADGLGTLAPPEATEDIFFQCADAADAGQLPPGSTRN